MALTFCLTSCVSALVGVQSAYGRTSGNTSIGEPSSEEGLLLSDQ